MISKVCVITNYRNTGNYGAVLQAYALNRKINNLGCRCETLNFSVNEQSGSKIKRYLIRINKREFISLWNDLKRDLDKVLISKKIRHRRMALNEFKENIPHTPFYKVSELEKINDKYDCFICGSDQIWRPTFESNLVGIYWLDVVKGNARRASYAASLGVDFLPEHLKDEARRYLEKFDYISVREEEAKKYFSRIVNKEIAVSVDPIFLLNREEWENLTRDPQIKEPYVFVYMIYGSKKLLRSIKQYAKQNKLKIVTFPYMAYYFRWKEFLFGDVRVFDADPSDFLGYIKNAKCVFTDSFHATAFSIIYHKTFFTSSANEKAFSRIRNLLSLVGLSNRCIPADGLIPNDYTVEDTSNWIQVDRRLESAISDSLNYLNMVLGKG